MLLLMAGDVVSEVVMQQQERQHRSDRWWKQYAANPNDDASGLLMKRQKLLVLRQAVAAFLSNGQPQNDARDAVAELQDLHKPSAAAQQHHSHGVRQLAPPAGAEPGVQLQWHNTVNAGTAQRDHELHSRSPQRPQQQTLLLQQEEHPDSKLHRYQKQQVHDDRHDRPSHRDLLHRLLGRAVPASGGDGPSTAAEAASDQQEHIEQQQHPWQRRKRLKPTAELPGHLQQRPAQQTLQQAVQQRRQVQQTGGRRRLRQQQPSNLVHHHTEQQQRQQPGESILQQQHQHEQCSRSGQQYQAQQLEQQQQQVHQVHVSNQLCDAQSQAVAPTAGVGSTAAATAVGSRRCSTAVQQLFSPRTAEHVPHADGVAGQQSCAAKPLHVNQQQLLQQQQQAQQQQQQHRALDQKGPKAAADEQQQQQRLHQQVCNVQQQQEEEAARAAVPPRSPQQQTQLSLHDHPSPSPVAAAAEVVIASTPTPCKMVPGTPYSPDPAPDITGEAATAAAAAAAAAAVVGDAGSDPCAVFGSYVAESPAAAAGPRSVVKGQNAAAPAVDSTVAQRLFETPQCPLQQEREPRATRLPVDSTSAAAVHAVAGDVEVQTDSRKSVVTQQQQQQQGQRVNGKHIGGKHHLTHANGILHMGATAQTVAGQSSSSSSVCLDVQQRVVQIDVGLPVTKLATCQHQCLVIMQQHSSSSSSSSRFELLLLQLQQQQQKGWDIALGESATVTVPKHGAGGAAAGAAALLDRGIKLLPLQQCATNSDTVNDGNATYSSWLQGAQGAVVAAAAPLELTAVTGQHTATAAAPPAAAAAVTPPGLSLQQPVGLSSNRVQELQDPADRVGIKTPGSGTCRDPPTCKRSLRSKLSDSSGKRKALRSRLGAAAAAAAGDDTEHHGVNIYRLSRVAKGASSIGIDPKQQQQQQGTVVHVQKLATDVAVTCLAVCEQQLLLAAAGSAGYACVWKLNRCSSSSSGSSATNQQQQGPVITAASEDSRVVLPAAAYRGISFPDITDLCFLVQPGSSSSSSRDSSSSSARVLLIGSCNQGSLAVWDVQLQQQIISVHTPDVNVHGLLPLQGPLGSSSSSSAVGSGIKGPCYVQQQQQPGPVLLLALVGGKDNAGVTTSTPSPITAAGASGVASAQLSHATLQQQQQQRRRWPKREVELRPILLQQPGSLVLGAPVLSTAQANQQQQQYSVAVQAAAVCGSLAAAAIGGDTGTSVKVWDLISGRTVVTAELPGKAAAAGAAAAAATAGDVLSVGLITMSQQIQQQQQHEVEDAGSHTHRDGVRGVVLMGSSSGILTMAIL